MIRLVSVKEVPPSSGLEVASFFTRSRAIELKVRLPPLFALAFSLIEANTFCTATDTAKNPPELPAGLGPVEPPPVEPVVAFGPEADVEILVHPYAEAVVSPWEFTWVLPLMST